jgi:hypothetical protein
LFATALFVAVTAISGGLSHGDANVSVYVTWALSHGHLACGYVPAGALGYAPTAPLYPLLSGALAALLRIGHNVSFPTSSQLGPHCVTATSAINHWALRSGAWTPTLRIGFVGWLILMLGVILLLRATGRGRCAWEPFALSVMACAPPIAMCLAEYFHPQDLVALGLSLAGLACARNDRWIWAGVLLGLAITSQQFALLVFIPLVIAAPRERLIKFAGATLLAGSLIALPVIALTSGRAIASLLVGTGETSASSTLLGETGLHGSVLFALSRFLPLALTLALAWWSKKWLASALLEPIPLIALIATSLCLRLIFEVNLWGYYFMAMTVLLIILEIINGRIRVSLLVWIVLVTWASVDGGLSNRSSFHSFPIWLLQAVLVSSALLLATKPLVSYVHSNPAPRSTELV